ncbi:hypothetical protein Strain138_000194 [Pseudogemmatithrix spongiicola]|uniref:Uncharacterized protein n=1 Tax=Pseudogemmatithrix spongiicola TaxID=3062599 RepID=A0AA49JXA9_9BACT|nr:hypothetical protein Strain138_000194 [Gemmatimonadaceae bacterium 'strain 138']WKW13870.1 hypothetical protein Strain318_000194 [Gemmatimonadaceae bacterium 'strain 318']
MNAPGHSAVAAEHWLPVHTALVQGLVHACNNRVAALSGITQLYEAQLSTSEEGMQQLGGEVERMRQLMAMFRLVSATGGSRREPARMGEALRSAAALLAYHLEARQAQFTAPEDSPDVEPVLLLTGDPLRFALLAYLAAAAGAGKGGGVTASVARVLDETLVTITAPGREADLRAREEFTALAQAAEREGGSLRSAPGPDGSVLLLLALPGLQKATARG